jgi:hypothetical protein
VFYIFMIFLDVLYEIDLGASFVPIVLFIVFRRH